MIDRLIRYDNEKDLQCLVDDSMEFILGETKRIVEQDFKGSNDPNVRVLVCQNLTLSFVLQVLMKSHFNNELFVALWESQSIKAEDGSHLPVNNPDFFKGETP